jgi:hypothetical protein
MLHRLCGPPSIPLSFTVAGVLPRRCTYRVSYGTISDVIPTPSAHRLRRRLPGYLILFAPYAFAPQRQSLARSSPSPPVFFLISTDFTPTPGIPTPPPRFKLTSFQRVPRVEPGLSRQTWQAAYAPFTPNNSEQRSPLTCYRGCWHVISRGLFLT